IKSILTWVRLPKLPIHYFNRVVVSLIGNHIGKTVRMDLATSEGSRCLYTRVYVEVDLKKPLLGKYILEDRILEIEYEIMENLCFDCGYYGHKRDARPTKYPKQSEEAPMEQLINSEPTIEELDTGEWMMVQRCHRRKPSKH
ncbi:hypothetical protein LINPERHAP2_LOCUS14201, partial [Linum perenne]